MSFSSDVFATPRRDFNNLLPFGVLYDDLVLPFFDFEEQQHWPSPDRVISWNCDFEECYQRVHPDVWTILDQDEADDANRLACLDDLRRHVDPAKSALAQQAYRKVLDIRWDRWVNLYGASSSVRPHHASAGLTFDAHPRAPSALRVARQAFLRQCRKVHPQATDDELLALHLRTEPGKKRWWNRAPCASPPRPDWRRAGDGS